MMVDQGTLSNRLLSRLQEDDFRQLRRELEPVKCPRGFVLAEVGHAIPFVYFLESGIASVVVKSPEDLQAEAGIIGREGFVHPVVVLGDARASNVTEMQIAGEGFRIETQAFVELVEASASLRRVMLAFARAHFVQVTHTALANAVHQIDERLARWLLMVHDRSESDDIRLTHEYLSVMLSVRRPSVTTTLHVLEGNGLIENDRGTILIRRRAALEAFAADAYGAPEAEYVRLLGPL